MIKRIFAVLLTVVSLCAAVVSEPMFAYTPFPLDGLADNYKNNGHGKFATAPSTVYFNGAYHQFYCSNGQDSDNFSYTYDGKNEGSPWDRIRYRSSKDGVNWSAPRDVMHVKNPAQERSACDPSVVYGDDGYWYMLYTGNVAEYASGVYLARSNYIQGPYFKYTDIGWENEVQMAGTPKIMLRNSLADTSAYGTGQQTVVKTSDAFHVWYRVGIDGDLSHEIRYTSVKHLTDLKYDDFVAVSYKDPWEPSKLQSFSEGFYSIGDVRAMSLNGEIIYKMWLLRGYLWDTEGTLISRFTSNDGKEWSLERNENESDLDKYGYKFIHNMGVSGDEHGWIKENEKYLISFAAPYLNGRDDNTNPKIALNRAQNVLDGDEYQFNSYCHIQRDTSKLNAQPECVRCKACNGSNSDQCRWYCIRCDECKGGILKGYWAMWQVLVGGKVDSNHVYFPSSGFDFPHGVTGTNIDYFTGDYDGDGITDLGAVDRSTYKWYIYSSRMRKYIIDGEVLISGMNSNYEVITGDFDGDKKTDIGAVDKVNKRWYIRSSADKNDNGVYAKAGKRGISLPYIPWGWRWGDMDSKSTIVVGDYNGDGFADRAFYKGSKWYIISSAMQASDRNQGFYTVLGTSKIDYGWSWNAMSSADIVVPGDFDGDGITDRAIYNVNSSQWTSLSSRLGGQEKLTWHWKWMCNAGGPIVCKDGWHWGKSQLIEKFAPCKSCNGMLPVLGDFDGDGVDDLVQVNPSTGEWSFYGSLSYDEEFPDALPMRWSWLEYSEAPVILIGDFDGDGKADRAFADKMKRKFYVISSKSQLNGVDTFVKAFSGMSFLAKSASGKPIEQPKVAPAVKKTPSMNVSVAGRKVSVTDVENGSEVVVFNMLGKKILGAVAEAGAADFEVPSYGKFVVRSGAQSRVIMVK